MNKKILLIEDDFDTQFLFSECLREENYDVVSVDHGTAALEYLKVNEAPDLIVMDLSFPLGTPEQFVDQMRLSPEHSKTPIIVISGKSDIVEYSSKLKAAGFLKKPFDIDPMISLIQSTVH